MGPYYSVHVFPESGLTGDHAVGWTPWTANSSMMIDNDTGAKWRPCPTL
jgi:hypothetical protein